MLGQPRACAASSLAKRNICGVCARHRPARGTVPASRPASSTFFRVSASGTPSTAPSMPGRRASRQPMMSDTRTKGRAASWMATRSGACAARYSRPFRTDCCRLTPPRPAVASPSPQRQPDRGPRPLRRQRPGRGRCPASPGTHPGCGAGRLAARTAYCLGRGPPKRLPRPPATIRRCKLARPAR